MNRDFAKLTAAEHEASIRFLMKLPLAQLRRRQRILEREQQMGGTELFMNNLRVIEQHLDVAIDRKTFRTAHDRKIMYR
jgi:hypothetical protein